MVSFHCTYPCTYLKTLGSIAFIVNLSNMSSCKTDLVSVAGISMRSFLGDDTLRKFSRKCLGHWFPDIAGTGNTHSLIYIRTA